MYFDAVYFYVPFCLLELRMPSCNGFAQLCFIFTLKLQAGVPDASEMAEANDERETSTTLPSSEPSPSTSRASNSRDSPSGSTHFERELSSG